MLCDPHRRMVGREGGCWEEVRLCVRVESPPLLLLLRASPSLFHDICDTPPSQHN